MKSKLFLIAFILLSTFGYSQTFEITGTITDASTGATLPGVNVKVKNAQQSTTSDLDGKFSMSKVPSGATLVFTFIGYQTNEVKITKSQDLKVRLSEVSKNLEEVVLVGYGSKKKKDVTGAVSVVSSKTIEQLKPIKVEQALQGTVSGVTVTSQSGAPGAGLNIRIRGIGTNGNSEATVIIDGYKGDLSIINPDDIESITVLKDAQAAVYGTIGANGIVLVTTKSGRKNTAPKVTFNSYIGNQETSKKLNLLNATEYALLLNESYANGGQALPFPNASGLGTGTDWQGQVFGRAPIASSDFNISGGSDKIVYTISASDLKQQGIVGGDKTGFKRNTARFSFGVDLNDKLKLQSNLMYTYISRNSVLENDLGSVLFNAINTPSTLSTRDANGNYNLVPSTNGYGIEVINPLAQVANTYNDYKLRKFNGNFGLTYDVIKNFKLTSRIGFNSTSELSRDFKMEVNYGPGKSFNIPRSNVNQWSRTSNDYTFDFFGEYSKTFLENHKIKGTLGTTIFKEWGQYLSATGYDVPNNSWNNADLSLATGTSPAGGRDVTGYAYDERRLSYFLFLDYSFKDRYLIGATVRRDGSSRFGSQNQTAVFPSLTAGWIASDESFFSKIKFIDFLKVRASIGILGNDQIGNNLFLGTLAAGASSYVLNGVLVPGTSVGVLPNADVKWEESRKIDFGLDLKFLNKKIDVTVDLFNDTRNKLLIGNIPVSGITGIAAPGSGAPTVNAGSVENKGIEFAINYKDKITDNFNFTVGYNITKIKNTVTQVNNSTGYVEGGSFGVGQLAPARMQVGEALGSFYGYVTDGIFQNQAEINAHPSQSALGAATAPGDIRYKDLNGDGIIDVKDRTFIGKPIADYIMGFNVSLNYNNFDFVSYSYASVGNKMVRNYERTASDLNKLNYVLGRWTGEGTSTTVPRVTTDATNNNLFSDYFVEDASFLRIQTIQLGYTVSKKYSEKIGISKFRIYTGVNNLYTFTKYRGYDPAATDGRPIGGGIDYGFYPVPKTYMCGLNLTF